MHGQVKPKVDADEASGWEPTQKPVCKTCIEAQKGLCSPQLLVVLAGSGNAGLVFDWTLGDQPTLWDAPRVGVGTFARPGGFADPPVILRVWPL